MSLGLWLGPRPDGRGSEEGAPPMFFCFCFVFVKSFEKV